MACKSNWTIYGNVVIKIDGDKQLSLLTAYLYKIFASVRPVTSTPYLSLLCIFPLVWQSTVSLDFNTCHGLNLFKCKSDKSKNQSAKQISLDGRLIVTCKCE